MPGAFGSGGASWNRNSDFEPERIIDRTSTTSGTSIVSGPTGVGGSGATSTGNTGGGGHSTGTKAGIAIAAVLVVAILIGVAICVRRQKRSLPHAPTPISGEGGLEVGDAPPEFTALRRAELEVKEPVGQIITTELIGEKVATHTIGLDGGNELNAGGVVERRELDGTGTLSPLPPHAELASTCSLHLRHPRPNATAAVNLSELPHDGNIHPPGELSGISTPISEPPVSSPTTTPKRKPLSGSGPVSALKTRAQAQSQSPTSVLNWSNAPVKRSEMGVPVLE